MTFYSLPSDLTAISELIPSSISLFELSFWNDNFCTPIPWWHFSIILLTCRLKSMDKPHFSGPCLISIKHLIMCPHQLGYRGIRWFHALCYGLKLSGNLLQTSSKQQTRFSSLMVSLRDHCISFWLSRPIHLHASFFLVTIHLTASMVWRLV